MKSSIASITKDICDAIDQGAIFFTGAGISRDPPSNMPLANEVKWAIIEELCNNDYLQDFLKDNQEEIAPMLNDMMMEALFQILHNRLGQHALTFLNCYSNGKPNHNHQFLARMFKGEIIGQILTTNFDTLIEAALKIEGWNAGVDYHVYYGPPYPAGDTPYVCKLHGTIGEKGSIISVLDLVGLGLEKTKADLLSQMLDKKTFIFMGWSDADADITPVLKGGNSSYIWLRHRKEPKRFRYDDPALDVKEPVRELLTRHEGVVFDCNLNVLEKRILKKLGLETKDIGWCRFDEKEPSRPVEPPRIENSLKILLMADIMDNFCCFDAAIELYQDSFKVHYFSLEYRNAETLEKVGQVWRETNNLKKAKECFRKALHLYEELGAMQKVSVMHSSLGDIYLLEHQWKRAEKSFHMSLDVAKECGSKLLEARAYGNFGLLYREKGQYDEAVKYLKKDIKLSDRIGDYHGKGITYDYLGVTYLRKGNLRWAEHYCKLGLGINLQAQYRYGVSVSYQNLGNVYQAKEDYDEALTYYQEAHGLKVDMGDDVGKAELLNNIGFTLMLMGRFDEARERLEEAYRIFEVKNDGLSLAMVQHNLSALSEVDGNKS